MYESDLSQLGWVISKNCFKSRLSQIAISKANSQVSQLLLHAFKPLELYLW